MNQGRRNFLIGAGTLPIAASLPKIAPATPALEIGTKGDLYIYSTADARLAVGTNGQVLTLVDNNVMWAQCQEYITGLMTQILRLDTAPADELAQAIIEAAGMTEMVDVLDLKSGASQGHESSILSTGTP